MRPFKPLVLITFCAGAIGLFLYSETASGQQRKVQESTTKPKSILRNAASLDIQERCAKQAREAFKDYVSRFEMISSFENHYNTELNRCFVKIEQIGTGQYPNELISVQDAFEGKVYAEMNVLRTKERPLHITGFVTLASGERLQFNSDNNSEQFNKALKLYME